ncbi:glycosyltransferase family 4 protein [Klenkia terrae]|uniref:glycosyltransferase family 4 protein n=1 Tax=Klenkia terrae TaxID=1052259 RepID=UPI001CD84DD3|nr:glycosyltransferase family 1 protein [Klenkia terrae]
MPADRGGVGRYVDELLPALVRQGVDLVVVAQAHDVPVYRSLVPGAEVHAAPAAITRRPVRLLWEQTLLPVLARRVRADLVHSPHYTLPLLSPVPVVATVHDATFFTLPEVHLTVKRWFFQGWTRVALRRAARCLTPSAATRDELVRVAGADARRVDVALLGVEVEHFHVPTAVERRRVRELLDLEGPYLAFLGTLEPRKNVPALVRAWSSLPSPPALVLGGGRGWDPGVDGAEAAVPATHDLRRPGYLPLDLLAAFLGEAELVVYPSLGEGFGLPVLEAMASGAAVLTTPLLSLPEVGGDAVEYTGPDEDGIRAALVRLLDDPARRDDLRRRGVERARGFDWDACARAHVESYRKAVAG